MAKITASDLAEIPELHTLWRCGDPSGARADLSGADLIGANLIGADLAGVNLVRADLSDANLVRADLIGADLSDANLAGANLAGANLADANLIGANYTHKGVEAEKFLVMTNLYKYTTIAIIDKTGKHWIALGCKFQSREDWQTQFWNNLSEFPNDNSLKTRERQFALRTAEAWLDMMSSPEVQ